MHAAYLQDMITKWSYFPSSNQGLSCFELENIASVLNSLNTRHK